MAALGALKAVRAVAGVGAKGGAAVWTAAVVRPQARVAEVGAAGGAPAAGLDVVARVAARVLGAFAARRSVGAAARAALEGVLGQRCFGLGAPGCLALARAVRLNAREAGH